MPCATIHLHLADRILSHWEERPRLAPFPVGEPALRDAFLHGTLAPDMGFVPGVDRFLSDLAHYIAPAELTRSLLRGARTPREEAFAWGWAGHVVGDVVLHPMVGRAVGERLLGDRSGFIPRLPRDRTDQILLRGDVDLGSPVAGGPALVDRPLGRGGVGLLLGLLALGPIHVLDGGEELVEIPEEILDVPILTVRHGIRPP
jgi:hypothetical protein